MSERVVSVWQCLIPLAVLSTIFTIGLSFVALHGGGTPESAELLWALEFRIILAWWVSMDRRIRGYEVPFEFDAFVFFAWPFLVPYHLYRTRRGTGLLIVAGIYIMYLTPYVLAQIARIVR